MPLCIILSIFKLIFVTYVNHIYKPVPLSYSSVCTTEVWSQIAKFMGPTWAPPGSCWPQMGPISAPWSLLSGICHSRISQQPTLCIMEQLEMGRGNWWQNTCLHILSLICIGLMRIREYWWTISHDVLGYVKKLFKNFTQQTKYIGYWFRLV